MFIYLGKFLLAILFCSFLAFLYARYNKVTTLPSLTTNAHTNGQKKYRYVLVVLGVSLYLFLAFILSLSWIGGDDFFYPHPYNDSLINRLCHVAYKYCNWVSRFGEIIPGLTGIAESRWQQFLTTPIFVALIPFALFRLVKPSEVSIYSIQGVAFYILTVSLILIQPESYGCWRNFKCYTASTNYLWPLLGISYFLSFYRPDQQFNPKNFTKTVPGMFILGLYAGWSIECISCILAPCFAAICIYKYAKRRCYLPQFAGFLGVIMGTFMLFGSPAHSRRAQSASEALSLNIADMPFSDACDLACSITSQNVHTLSGGAIQAYFGDFPIILRPLFFPELMAEYLPCCMYSLTACAILIICLIFSKQNNKKQLLTLAGIGIFLSFLSATAYIMSGIPVRASFLPAVFIMIATAGFLILRSPHKAGMALALIMGGYLLHITIPAAYEAYTYLPARNAYHHLIHQKIAAGERTLELPYPLPTEPKDRLNLIKTGIFKENFDDYPNGMAREYYKVDNIRTLPRPKMNKSNVPSTSTNTQ
ncbi:MAG: hypothetical protein IJ985_00980 [Akkermansia sp.]|nr:hypothetical protein [Akkermansia sp.]